MHEAWNRLCNAYEMTETDTEDIYALLENLYSTPGRYYHTMKHIHEMIAAAELLVDYADDYNAVLFAVWFHDAIYNIKSNSNEADSANLLERCIDNDVDWFTVRDAKKLVMVTVDHQPKPNTDEELICDLDFMRMAAPYEQFCTYGELIWPEYASVYTYGEFWAGRYKFLGALSTRDYLFHTPVFREKCEARARENINRFLREGAIKRNEYA